MSASGHGVPRGGTSERESLSEHALASEKSERIDIFLFFVFYFAVLTILSITP